VFTLAPEAKKDHDQKATHLPLQLAQLRRIYALQTESADGLTSQEYSERLDQVAAHHSDESLLAAIKTSSSADTATPPIPTLAKTLLQATDEEKALKSYTRRRLEPLKTWPLWKAAFKEQLDAHATTGTFGPPTMAPAGSTILHAHWANLVKTTGRRKCRVCCDGSKRRAPELHRFTETYASCVEQPCMRIFFALAAARGQKVFITDATNAYANAPPPTFKSYLAIDDTYREWYHDTYPDRPPIQRGMVLPIEKALQGHPEAGRLWERLINSILVGKLKLQPCTHEKSLYHGTFNGENVIICRMVDDICISCDKDETADKFIAAVEASGIDITIDKGGSKYNGVDILQTRDYIKISCESFIDRMLCAHGWSTPGENESDRHDMVPIPSTQVKELMKLEPGPAENTPAHAALEKEMGFGYRTLLGELTYAYVTCRLDIAFAVSFLARFSTRPTRAHYQSLRHLCKYLRAHKDWGLMYWRGKPRLDAPIHKFTKSVLDADLPAHPTVDKLTRLTGYVDASHATCLDTRRSITGVIFTLAGGAIAFKSKRQATVSTSSTEAELMAAVFAAKMAKYFRSILKELEVEQTAPTILYEDNESAIKIVNASRPTERTRHIDIAHFAIQEWKQQGDITLAHIPGVINCSDSATKGLASVLHRRHVMRAMGHYGPSLS
jgi:hypothetical protein